MSGASSDSLPDVLVLALTLCHDQVRKLQERSARIEQLQCENERLRKELQHVREEREANVATQNNESTQIDELFQKNVEAQAEVHRLRKKLKAYKDKANGRLSLPISSPMSLPTTPATTSPRSSWVSRHEELESGDDHQASSLPSGKRPRADEEDRYQDEPTKTVDSLTCSNAAKRSKIDDKIAAIPLIAEDGDDYNTGRSRVELRKLEENSTSVHKRLPGLLSAPAPNRTMLARPSGSPGKGISNIMHTSTEPSRSSSSRPERAQIDSDAADSTHSTTSDVSFKLSGKSLGKVPNQSSTPARPTNRRSLNKSTGGNAEDEEPIRTRPLTSLSLHHFKPNPRWLSSHDMSYEDFLRGKNGERIKTLAATLPSIPGQREANLTDDQIIVDFLGPGSEARVANTHTCSAQNLLDEAKMRRVAQYFARTRADYDKEGEPPGFWNQDFPGSQEDKENREAAKRLQMEEVKRRRDDAMRGGGRWCFADE